MLAFLMFPFADDDSASGENNHYENQPIYDSSGNEVFL